MPYSRYSKVLFMVENVMITVINLLLRVRRCYSHLILLIYLVPQAANFLIPWRQSMNYLLGRIEGLSPGVVKRDRRTR